MRALLEGIEVTGQGDYVRIASLELLAAEINRNNIDRNTAELGVFRGNFAKEINRSSCPDVQQKLKPLVAA